MAALRTVFCKNLFAGKVAIVTGGGTGIGKAITKELALLGCKVVIASRKLERLQETAGELNNDPLIVGGGASSPRAETECVYPFECNIRKEEQVGRMLTPCTMPPSLASRTHRNGLPSPSSLRWVRLRDYNYNYATIVLSKMCWIQ